MAKILEYVEEQLPTLGELEMVEDRGSFFLVEFKGQKYGLSKRRFEASSQEEGEECLIDRYNGKWLIPTSTVKKAPEIDW